MNKKEQAIREHRMQAAMESENIWGVKNKQIREHYARNQKDMGSGKKAHTKSKTANKKAKIAAKKQAILKQQVDAAKEDLWGDKKAREAARANFTEQSTSKQGSSPTVQNNTSASSNTNSNNTNSSSNQANAKTNAGNQTTTNPPQSNNVSNNANQPNNNTKSTPSTGSTPVSQKPIWEQIKSKGARMGIPIVTDIALSKLNSTSPTNNELLPYNTLTENIKNQDGNRGILLNVADMVLNPMNSYYWQSGRDWYGDMIYDIWSNGAGMVSDDKAFTHNVGATARDVAKDIVNMIAAGVDIGGYLWAPAARAKATYVTSKAATNNIWDTARDFEDIKDYSYKNLGFSDYIGSGDYFGSTPIRGIKAGFNNLFSIFGENRDFYQRGRYSLNEILSTMAKDIENHKDKNSPEYKDLVNKFEKFNNLAKSSDFYWATKKEMDASDLSEEDFFKSKNITPQQFELSKQNAHALHNLGSNLVLNENNGNKRSDYVKGNYSYQDYTDAVNKAKKSLEGDSADIDTDTLNAAINVGTDVGKATVNKSVDIPIRTGTSNATNENSQSNLTPDYLTEFYKKFDKQYNYDPAKGRFNIWL